MKVNNYMMLVFSLILLPNFIYGSQGSSQEPSPSLSSRIFRKSVGVPVKSVNPGQQDSPKLDGSGGSPRLSKQHASLVFNYAEHGDAESLTQIQQLALDVNAVSRGLLSKELPLNTAIRANCVAAVQGLISLQVDVERGDKDGLPLAVALDNKRAVITVVLLDYVSQEQLNSQDAQGYSLLMQLLKSSGWHDDTLPVVRKFIEHKPNLDVQSRDGDSALMIAVRRRESTWVRELINAGVRAEPEKPWIGAMMAFTPLTFAQSVEEYSIAYLLTSAIKKQQDEAQAQQAAAALATLSHS